jgi:uncharacterized membrane protein YfcA
VDSLIHLAPAGYLVVLTAVTVGSLVQGSVGFGANMVAAPVLAVVEPRALPAALMLPVLPLTLAMMRRERHGVDWRSVGWLMAGRVPGTVAGSLVVAAVAAETLSVLAGVAVLVAVLASLLTATIPVTPGTEVATGGPPLALLYQHHEGPVLRATLAATFALGTALSVVGLALAGAIEGWHVWLAAALMPGTLAGVAASNRLVGRVDGAWLRPAVLAFASIAAALAVARGLA